MPSNYDYSGDAPDFFYYLNAYDTEETKSHKLQFYRLISSRHWNFRKELISFMAHKLQLLTESILLFLAEIYSFQDFIRIETHQRHLGFIHLLNAPICTLSGLIYRVYKYFYLNNFPIHVVMNEHGKCINISRVEHQYASYLDFKFPEKQFIFQKGFKESTCDLYSAIDGLAVYVNGCYWHSHIASDCPFNKGKTGSSLNFQGKTHLQGVPIFMTLFREEMWRVKKTSSWWN